MNKLIIGLTGLIGSGKSTVAETFATHGANIIDTDKIAHELTRADNLEVLNLISNAFGTKILTLSGELDRVKLRELVFNDVTARLTLERILHPRILAKVTELIQQSVGNAYIILVVPLLFKSPEYLNITDYNIFVDCDESLIFERVHSRSGLSEVEIKQILMTQVVSEVQKGMADDVISNNGDIANLESQVEKLHNKHINLSLCN